MDAYSQFLARKAIIDPPTGISGPVDLPSVMFPFQRDITAWLLKRGRGAAFEGTGLGKSLQELAWGEAVARETKREVIHFAPLAVTAQMQREAVKFGIDPQTIVNYHRMSHHDLPKAGGVILDESSILKSVDGHYRSALIAACADIPFRLAATATPAPNDFMELGNHAEFLGVMSYTDMLATFFVHDGGDTQKWRLKGHAENEFWKWMASWAVMIRKPSDLGYSDEGYDLPPLNYIEHRVGVDYAPSIDTGFLFPMQARTLSERIGARRATVGERVDKAAEVTAGDDPFVWWCNLNAEAELAAKRMGAVNLHGGLSDTEKERIILDFQDGKIKRLVTKASIAGFGVNWQCCHQTGFIGLNDSWEQFYQAIRRFWRFGQTKPVDAHLVVSELEGATVANIRRKEADADRMAAAMVMHMADLSSVAVRGSVRDRPDYDPQIPVKLPDFLEIAA
jgi:hypothetical protein